jgi:hypothetical protein
MFDDFPGISIMLVHQLLTSRLLVLASALAGSFSRRLRFPRRLVGYFTGVSRGVCEVAHQLADELGSSVGVKVLQRNAQRRYN